MAVDIIEFNKEVVKYSEGNYSPVIYYLKANMESHLFYNVCRKMIEVMKERDIYVDSNRKIKRVVFKKESMKALVVSINDLTERLSIFSFNQFYVMLLMRFHLALTDDERKEAIYLGNEAQFKLELMQLLHIENKSPGDYVDCLNRKFVKLSVNKQELFSRLSAMRDTFLFELGEHCIVAVGRRGPYDTIKYAKLCGDTKILKKFGEIVHSKVAKKERINREEWNVFYDSYQKFQEDMTVFMNDTEGEYESENRELISFIEDLSEEQSLRILKQLQFYQNMHRRFF